MTARTIGIGVTRTIGRSLAAGDTLTIKPTGVGIVSGSIGNAGTILVNGGGAFYGPAELSVTGTLGNSGTISLAGGRYDPIISSPGAAGAQMNVSGVLVNTGCLNALGGVSGGYLAYGSAGGTLAVSGVLTNAGQILLGGGGPETGLYAFSGGLGGVLADTGSVRNDGTILVQGGRAPSPLFNAGGAGGVLSIVGTISNNGTIMLAGGGNTYAGAGQMMVIGALTNAGVVIDAGDISVFAGPPGSQGQNGQFFNNASLVVDGSGGSGAANAATAGLVTVSSQIVNNGTITVGGGFGATAPGKAGGLGGTITITGEIDQGSNASLVLLGGTAGSGGGSGGGGAQVMVDGLFNLSGTVTVGAGQGGAAGTLVLGSQAFVDNSGLLQNDGVLELQAGAIVDNGFGQGVTNTGTITGSGNISYTLIQNQGVVDVGSGRIVLEGDGISSPGGQGLFVVDAGGLLSLTGSSLDEHQAISLTGSSAAVSLDVGQAGVAIASPNGGQVSLLGGGAGTLAASDSHLSVFLAEGSQLTLSTMAFIDAVGSSRNDKITALSSGQTLTGGGGTDQLFGAVATGDLFQDTALGLNTDLISGFAGTDAIDITDIAASGVMLGYTGGAGGGTLTVSGSHTSTAITLSGVFTASSFVTAPDGHGGVLITLHH